MRSVGESEVRYTHAGDVDIAWSVMGNGPIDILYVPGFISHLDLARELPVFDAVIGRLGRLGRVLTFDKRGTGLSGRDLGFGSLAERADDIRVVMDAAGWERAHLVGISEGGPLSLLFAASFPERVQSLVLYGSFACLLPEDDPASADFDVPRFSTTSNAIGAQASSSAPSSMLHRTLRSSNNWDVTNAPVRRHASLSRSCDRIWPSTPDRYCQRFRRLRSSYTAPTIPSWALPVGVPWPPHSGTHSSLSLLVRCIAGGMPVSGPPHSTRWRNSLTGTPAGDGDIDRILATVLFTDIVESTQVVTQAGDHLWHDILNRHDSETRRIVARFGGRVVKHTGDGTLATFDSPTRAVHCAALCATASAERASRSGPDSIPGRSSDEGTTSLVLASISVRVSRVWRDRRKFSSRGPCMTWLRAQIFDSRTAACRP